MSLLDKVKQRAGVSFEAVKHNVKQEMLHKKAANQQIKAKAKGAYYKEKERIAIKKAKEKARTGGFAGLMSGNHPLLKKDKKEKKEYDSLL